MKKHALLFVFALLGLCLSAQTPDWEWAVKAGGTSTDYGIDICTDSSGNSYVTGYFAGTATFGSFTLVSAGGMEIFVAKVDPDGNYLWVTKAGGTSNEGGMDITMDSAGNIYVTGYYFGTATFGSHSITAVMSCDIFVAKMDTSGSWLWVTSAGGSYYDQGLAIDLDNSGNCYITGYYTGTASFGSFSLSDSATFGEEFVAKLDPNGTFLWVTGTVCAAASRGRGIATDNAGNIYVSGSYEGTVTFGTTVLTCSGSNDAYAAKLDSSGNWLWAVRAGGEAGDWANSLVTDASGISYITGGFTSEDAVFGSITIPGNGWDTFTFIACLNTDGTFLWANPSGGFGDTEGQDIVVDGSGNSYITGFFESNASFGSLSLTSYGGRDAYIAKLDNYGTFLWAVHAGSVVTLGGGDVGNGVALSSGGHVHVTGGFYATASFGSHSLTSSGTDVFITKLTEPLSAPYPVTLLFPTDGAMNLPIGGFDLQWEPDTNGAPPESYMVYLADDPGQIYAQNSWYLESTSFDPVMDGSMAFGYDQVWYWTIEAVNAGGSSFVEPPRTFTTQSEFLVTSFPTTWDFEGPSFLPDGWITADLDGVGTFWTMMTEDNHTPGGSQCAVHSYSTEAPEGQTGWMITAPVAVPTGQFTTLSFWHKSWWEGWYDYSGLLVNTTNDPNAAGWTELWNPPRVNSQWNQEFLNISAYGGQTVYFAFKYTGYDAHTWIVDDVSIYQVNPVTVFPAVWDFEGTTFPPEGWSQADLDCNPTSWQMTSDFNHTDGGGQSAMHPYSTLWPEDPGQDGWLLTPPVEVPSGDNMVLDFWYFNLYAGGNKYCALKVNTTNDPHDLNWVELWRPNMVYEEWREQAVNVSAYGGQTVYFAFHYQGNDADNWIVDDVTIYHPIGEDTLGPVISFLPPMNSPFADQPYRLTATVTDDPTFNNPLGGVMLHYMYWGSESFTEVPMTLDSGNTYFAMIPALGYYGEIDYYFEAWDVFDNHVNTEIYNWFWVDNPCWLSYDMGGTGHVAYPTDFGVANVYENPFFAQGIPMQVLQTGCGSNMASTANLHIYAYDGTSMTDLMTPQAVNLNENEWITYHDLSELGVMVETQYFVVAYENIPANTGIWHDRRFDYDASFLIDNGFLLEKQIPGSWVLPVQITNGGLFPPQITITPVDWYWLISWEPVQGAAGYNFYGSGDPSAPDPWTLLQTTPDSWCFYQEPEPMQFFRVTTLSELPQNKQATQAKTYYKPNCNIPGSPECAQSGKKLN
jgi:hypothetical protein